MAAMHDYLAKAHENLASAESELQHGRNNSCARSAYYACFHAAIAALLHAGLTAKSRPEAGDTTGFTPVSSGS